MGEVLKVQDFPCNAVGAIGNTGLCHVLDKPCECSLVDEGANDRPGVARLFNADGHPSFLGESGIAFFLAGHDIVDDDGNRCSETLVCGGTTSLGEDEIMLSHQPRNIVAPGEDGDFSFLW